ncbi:SRPBCC domain-containing protein [Ideonella alba]|uniref:SRPBCC domain-containing protein n=1 Tax=Ideonella alba TaxID=2824118 RepID=UPI001FFD1C67|nr:SRPBCC domain-containing protein [Ideonella alba]
MYGFTLSGPQMLFFSVAHSMPLLVLAIWLAMPTGALWLAQSAAALAWPKYRFLAGVSALSAATFLFALASQAGLLATYDEWSSSEAARTPLCLLGLVTTAMLMRESWRALRHSAPFNPPAPAMLQDRTLSTSRTLPHSPAAVYNAFASASVLAAWWGPAGFSNTFEIFEFRPGGRWKFVMHSADGKDYPNESVFAALEPAAKVVIEHVAHPHYTLTVTLKPAEQGTLLTWEQTFKDSKTAQGLRHMVEPANEQNLDRLAQALAKNEGAV